MIAIGFYNYQKICPKVLPNTFTTTLAYSWLLYFAVYSTNPVTKPLTGILDFCGKLLSEGGNVLNKYLKITLGVLGVIVLGIGILMFDFVLSMKPDKDKEEQVRVQAEQYLEENFEDGRYEIYDVWYDNMDIKPFEYASKVRSEDNIEFLVYLNKENKTMEDTYVAEKWAKNLYSDLNSYLIKNISDIEEVSVMFDDEVGSKYNLNFKNAGEYKDYEASATILITLSRNLNDNDKNLLNGVTNYLKSELKVKHATVEINTSKDNKINPLVSQF